jgi:hypothetical protein
VIADVAPENLRLRTQSAENSFWPSLSSIGTILKAPYSRSECHSVRIAFHQPSRASGEILALAVAFVGGDPLPWPSCAFDEVLVLAVAFVGGDPLPWPSRAFDEAVALANGN